jgi:hypothetical protein
MIRFACPRCRAAYRAPRDKAGKRTTCPACAQRFRIPGRKRARAAAPAEPAPKGPGLLSFVLAGCAVAVLIGVVATAGAALVRPAAGRGTGPDAALTPGGIKAAGATTEADPDDLPDADLFEMPPRTARSLPAAQQARLQRKYEPIYLDPAAADREHIVAANALLALPRGPEAFLKGLDMYEGRPELRRRYRWCLLYLCIAQHDRDAAAPADVAETPGIVPGRHVAAMIQLIRDVDPAKRPDREGQFSATLTYLGRHPEHAGPLLPVLRDMQARLAGGNAGAARQVGDAIRGIEQGQ